MTGRYSLENKRTTVLKDDMHQLGSMFEKNGYYTGIIGRDQPYKKKPYRLGETKAEKKSLRKSSNFCNFCKQR